jgi:cytochrome c2
MITSTSSSRLVAAAATILLVACNPPPAYRPEVTGGDAVRGSAAITRYQCGACHLIPGIPGARGRLGPPLESFARHSYIAGRYPNTPELLMQWLQDPPAMAPRTAMPDVGISHEEARDMAAFLYTLE